MENKKFILKIVCGAFILAFSSGCGTNVTTTEPIGAPEFNTEAPASAPTYTPIIQSTAAPTSTPIVQSTAPPPSAYVFNATVVSRDGISFEISNAYIARRTSTGYYYLRDDHYYKDRVEDIYFYTNLTNITIPLNAIQSIQSIDDILDFEHKNFKIALENGVEMEGKIERYVDNNHLDMTIGGTTSVNGYAAEYDNTFTAIISVTFSKNDQGVILAEVTERGGKVVHLSNPWFRKRIPDDNWGIEPVSSVKFVTGQYTLEIPLGDIAKIEEIDVDAIVEEGKYATLILTSGEKMSGKFDDYLVIIGGKNTVEGILGEFYADFGDISSVTIHK